MRSEKEKMLAGELYRPGGPELAADEKRAKAWMVRYNTMLAAPVAERLAALRELFADVGDGCVVRPPFHCDYGSNIRLGQNVFINFECVILDSVSVVIGDGTQIASKVQIIGADHPRDPEQRRAMLEFGRPVHIGANVWIGAGAIILPGVTVGDDAIVGAGSVVTRDVAPGTTVVGNPAKPLPRRAPSG